MRVIKFQIRSALGAGDGLPSHVDPRSQQRRTGVAQAGLRYLGYGLLCAALLILPSTENGPRASTSDRPQQVKRAKCGFDGYGADEQRLAHRANTHRREKRRVTSPEPASLGSLVQDSGDVCVIEDDGTIVIPANGFDLKQTALTFIPRDSGYSVSFGGSGFSPPGGTRLAGFTGRGGEPDTDDGYAELDLADAPIRFWGEDHDRVFVGTNGFITFLRGDASPRPSPAALAVEMPRVSPLWADLDLSQGGSIFHERLPDGHVFTWQAVADYTTGKPSTFQILFHDDGRIEFAYRKVKARTSLVGVSPGESSADPLSTDLSETRVMAISGAIYESFSKKKRLDFPALTRAFYREHGDDFDTICAWTDFAFDNGTGLAHAFNVRNEVQGIGLGVFDRGGLFGSSSRLATILSMGTVNAWPTKPQAHHVGLNSALSILAHEQGHRWLAYVRFDGDGGQRDDLLGRQLEHWSFLMDTRTDEGGSFSSLMEGNAWRNNGNGTFTTSQSSVNYFSNIDLYLMGLIPPESVGPIQYLEVDGQLKAALRGISPVNGFTISAVPRTTNIKQIVKREGPRIPDAMVAPKTFRMAFVLVLQQGQAAKPSVIAMVDRYRSALASYYSLATGRLATLETSLK